MRRNISRGVRGDFCFWGGCGALSTAILPESEAAMWPCETFLYEGIFDETGIMRKIL